MNIKVNFVEKNRVSLGISINILLLIVFPIYWIANTNIIASIIGGISAGFLITNTLYFKNRILNIIYEFLSSLSIFIVFILFMYKDYLYSNIEFSSAQQIFGSLSIIIGLIISYFSSLLIDPQLKEKIEKEIQEQDKIDAKEEEEQVKKFNSIDNKNGISFINIILSFVVAILALTSYSIRETPEFIGTKESAINNYFIHEIKNYKEKDNLNYLLASHTSYSIKKYDILDNKDIQAEIAITTPKVPSFINDFSTKQSFNQFMSLPQNQKENLTKSYFVKLQETKFGWSIINAPSNNEIINLQKGQVEADKTEKYSPFGTNPFGIEDFNFSMINIMSILIFFMTITSGLVLNRTLNIIICGTVCILLQILPIIPIFIN